SGRLYPVNILYRPVLQDMSSSDTDTSSRRSSADEERDLIDAVVDGVAECARHGAGDVLVFLPGEREIRETAEALRKSHLQGADVLPLYARLSQSEQEQIFRPKGNARSIVLATNIAESTLAVPGMRDVVDSGLARVTRYSWRNKVEQLRIEAISEASANQRSGRCGQIGPGVCIRLDDEADFKNRTPFT